MDKKTWINRIEKPYDLYIKVLNECFPDRKNSETLFPKELSDGRFFNVKYQEDAIVKGINILKKHQGVIIADVVGLGKSIIAMAIAKNLDSAISIWAKRFSNLKDKEIIFYHNSWPYFSKRFGLKTVDFLEPKPMITPSPSKLNQVIQKIKSDGIEVIASESYFSDQAPKFIASKAKVKIVKLAQSVGAIEGADSYINLFETNLTILAKAYGVSYD